MMGAHHALEIDRVLRHTGFGLQIAVIDRQREIAERNARHVDARLREFVGRRHRELGIMRACAQRAGDDQDSQCGHEAHSGLLHPANAPSERQRLRYTQTRAGGRFIQIRSEASVDTPGSDFGIGGITA